MFLVLLLILFNSGLVLSEETCPDICTFVYSDPNWLSKDGYDTEFTVDVASGPLGAGIVTAEYGLGDGLLDGYLEFVTKYKGDKPLVLRFDHSRVRVYGQQSMSTRGEVTFKIPDPSDYFQITDKAPDHYVIIVGNSESKGKFTYNYNSEEVWNEFQRNEVRLRDTVRITNKGRAPVFNYISICPDATPRLCDDQPSTVVEAELGEPYTLTCSATGAPFLAASWIKDGAIKPSSKETRVSHGPNHRITSEIEIKSFTVDYIGRWTCAVQNKNFGETVTKTHELRYSLEVSLEQSPSEHFYIPEVNGSTTFEWIVTGWPFDQVTLECDDVEETQLTKDTSGHLNTDRPSVNLMLTLQNEDQVVCSVRQGDKVLDTTNITRVGYGCAVGEKGIGKDCEVCPLGETSVEGSADCFAAESDCQEGLYGTGKDCSPCPKGESSPANSVKIQECLKIKHGSGVSTPLVIGASVAAALMTAGLFLLVPRLMRI